MSRRIFFIVIGLLFVVLLPLSSMATPEVTPVPGLGLNVIENMKPNGVYRVFTWKDGTWQDAGSLSFDRFFREQEMDLRPYITGEGEVRIRLVQQGGGAAHIDAVFLGGKPARELKAKDKAMTLKKLSQKDFDVIDSFNKTIELVFPKDGKDKTLKITARVEGERISETPFQFPRENLYKPMDEHSQFYPYKFGSQDGNEPFFREYSPTGSGHPSGFTYGWVSNDEKNLYVTIDFTPDNTMDGEKDYAKVYAKTGEGLKEFKVSVPETNWGKSEFTYTDKVAYQHKVYEFQIPLKELGIDEIKNETKLQLAFSAYGTASPPGNYHPALAYDPMDNRYLVVYKKEIPPDNSDIYGQILNADGTAYGSEFPISTAPDWQSNPSVAYDSANQRFLVAWEDYRDQDTTGYDIYGQIVNANGSLNGSNFAISTATNNQYISSVAYDSGNGRFLVAWYDFRNFDTGVDIYGQLVNANGSLYGSNFPISTAITNQNGPSVAYDNVNGRFLVVWYDHRNSGTGADIYGQFVNPDGSLYGSNFPISTATGHQYSPSVAYDSANQRFLVTWYDSRNFGTTSFDIYGQLVNANGSLNGLDFTISNADDDQSNPSVAYDSGNGRFLVAWEDFRNDITTHLDIYGQLVNATGSLDGSNFPISTAPDNQSKPSVAYNPHCGNFLVAFETWDVYDITFALLGECSPDLIVQSISTDPFFPSPGEPVNVTVTVKNEGGGDALETFFVEFYTDPDLFGDFFICEIAGLAAGTTTTCIDTVFLFDEKTYDTWTYVDADNVVVESNEDNNVFGPRSICVITGGDIESLVAWYYWSILDRCPEPGGAEGWVAEIERIVSLGIDIKEGFIALGKLFFNSQEYLDKNTSGDEYIIDLYETFLGRTPSDEEVAGWAGEFAGGLTRNLLLNYFIFSPEFRTYMEGIFGFSSVRPEYILVNDLYRGFLARLPDDGGYNSWLDLMQDAQCTGEQAVRDLTGQIGLLFIQSAEYDARNPELNNPGFSSEFVTNLYDAILRRGAELAGYLGWKGQYDSGALTKEEILQFFVASDEFQDRVQEIITAGCLECAIDNDCPVGQICESGSCVDCNCPTIWDPVCGVDGNTYSNECFADCAHVNIAHPGECNGAG